MCLLITGPAASIKTLYADGTVLRDVYDSNSDGLGAMFAKDGKLHIRKVLPKTVQDAAAFIDALPDTGELALHWRMRTHGAIDLTQCHPYEVNEGTWMMHNGILSTGNKADPTKSDTWHFINDYLKDMPPDVLHNENVAEMIGDYIGSNRFAIMSSDGRLTVVNRSQGIEHEELWFSNTYAWTPSLVIPSYRGNSFRGGAYTWDSRDYESYWTGLSGGSHHSPTGQGSTTALTPLTSRPAQPTPAQQPQAQHSAFAQLETLENEVIVALENADLSELTAHLENRPEYVVQFILDAFAIAEDKEVKKRRTPTQEAFVDAWVVGDEADIVAGCKAGFARSAALALLTACEYIYVGTFEDYAAIDEDGEVDDAPSELPLN